jgi:hypothetical protein
MTRASLTFLVPASSQGQLSLSSPFPSLIVSGSAVIMSLEMCMELHEHVIIIGQSCVSRKEGRGRKEGKG